MKRNIIIICISVFVLAVLAYAERAELPTDARGVKIQAWAPLKKNDVALTGNSQTIDVTNAMAWGAYVAADTKFRVMSTATKVGVQHTLPGGSWYVEVVPNPDKVADYKFVNLSTVGGTGTFRSDKP